MNEKEKMMQGLWYGANYDQELIKDRLQAMDLCFELNQLKPSQQLERQNKIKQIIGECPEGLVLLSPFACDYGRNIHLGHDVFININCYFMDCATIHIGNHVFIGPSCGFYTAKHPLDYQTRNQGIEQALPITVGDHCWFGANVTVLPGVTIGKGCVIGAGSVVSKNIPDHSLASGVPARVVKTLQ